VCVCVCVSCGRLIDRSITSYYQGIVVSVLCWLLLCLISVWVYYKLCGAFFLLFQGLNFLNKDREESKEKCRITNIEVSATAIRAKDKATIVEVVAAGATTDTNREINPTAAIIATILPTDTAAEAEAGTVATSVDTAMRTNVTKVIISSNTIREEDSISRGTSRESRATWWSMWTSTCRARCCKPKRCSRDWPITRSFLRMR
jgi:hypothetical protein